MRTVRRVRIPASTRQSNWWSYDRRGLDHWSRLGRHEVDSKRKCGHRQSCSCYLFHKRFQKASSRSVRIGAKILAGLLVQECVRTKNSGTASSDGKQPCVHRVTRCVTLLALRSTGAHEFGSSFRSWSAPVHTLSLDSLQCVQPLSPTSRRAGTLDSKLAGFQCVKPSANRRQATRRVKAAER